MEKRIFLIITSSVLVCMSEPSESVNYLEINDSFAVRWDEDFRKCGDPVDKCPKLGNINYRDQPFSCRCDNDCLKYGDCCVSVLKNQRKLSKDSYFYRCERLPDSLESVRMITKCPWKYPSSLNKLYCEEAPESEPFESLDVPVIDLRNGDIYRNIYCARCHSVPIADIYINYHVNCSFTSDQMSEFGKNAVYDRREHSWNDASNPLRYCDLRLLEFHPDRITELVPTVRFCSTHPTWPEDECSLDLSFEGNRVHTHLCTSYVQPVQYAGQELFRNPHCARCVHPDISITYDLRCARSTIGRPQLPFGKPKENESDSMEIDAKGRAEYFQNCGDNDILDLLENKCISTYCGEGYELVNGECMKLSPIPIPNNPEQEPTHTTVPCFTDHDIIGNGSVAIRIFNEEDGDDASSDLYLCTRSHAHKEYEIHCNNNKSMSITIWKNNNSCSKPNETLIGYVPALSYMVNLVLVIYIVWLLGTRRALDHPTDFYLHTQA